MLPTNDLKFKNGRIWRAKYIPNPKHPMGYDKLVFEDATLEIAHALKIALEDESHGLFNCSSDVDIFELDT